MSAKKLPRNWYRTIDRIYPAITTSRSFLIPDIKGEAHIVFERGKLYPHHNLYFITSDEWDLRPCKPCFLSGIARLFISHLLDANARRLFALSGAISSAYPLPYWHDVPPTLRDELVSSGGSAAMQFACNSAVFKTSLERLAARSAPAIGGNGD